MATAYPPTLERRDKVERQFVNKLIALEAVRISNPVTRTLAYWSVSLAVQLTGAMKVATVGRCSEVATPAPLHQAQPETSRSFAASAIRSAFSRAIARDSEQYSVYRASVPVSADAPDSAPIGEQPDLFPGLSAYRESLGV